MPGLHAASIPVIASPREWIQPLDTDWRHRSPLHCAHGMKLADTSDMNHRLPLVMSQYGLHRPSDPDTICRVIRFAYGVLIALLAGMGAWLLFSRI